MISHSILTAFYFSSEGLTSLKFLKNLQKISTNPENLEAGLYGLVIYDNENLSDLWQPDKNFEIAHGSIYVQMNKKLCNRKLREFARKVKHDVLHEALQTNDQEVLCDPAKLFLDIKVSVLKKNRFVIPNLPVPNLLITKVEYFYKSYHCIVFIASFSII